MNNDEKWMKIAINEAINAEKKGEVPVGAIIVKGGKLIAKAHNQPIFTNDPTAHAEMQVLTSASSYLQNKYLNECTLYVTLEPCVMCAGATFWTRAQNSRFTLLRYEFIMKLRYRQKCCKSDWVGFRSDPNCLKLIQFFRFYIKLIFTAGHIENKLLHF